MTPRCTKNVKIRGSFYLSYSRVHMQIMCLKLSFKSGDAYFCDPSNLMDTVTCKVICEGG